MLGGHGPRTDRLGRLVAAPFIALRVAPNVLTLFGTLLFAAPCYFAWRGDYLLAGITLLLAAAFDMLDGVVARATNRVTTFGGYLDSVLDRVGDAAILVAIGAGTGGAIWWLVIGAALVGQYLTSYTRARAYQDVRVPPETWRQVFERPERVFFLTIVLAGQGVWNWLAPAAEDRARLVGPGEFAVPQETAVVFWGLFIYAAAALWTATIRVFRVRRLLRQIDK